MTDQPLVSAIIPTYNRAAYIVGAIESVRCQTYRNVEIIVVDDGSTDDTQARLERYGSSIRVISQANRGPAAARNVGIDAAKGDIVALLDSDDVWEPDKLQRQVSLLQQAGDAVPCCLCNAWMVSPDGSRIETFQYSRLSPAVREGLWLNPAEVFASRFVLFAQAAAIRRKVLDRIGGFDESLRFHEDHELPLRLALEGPWAFIGDPLVSYRRDSPGSYAAIGEANALPLSKCVVQMWDSLYGRVRSREDQPHLRRLFWRKLQAARLGLRTTQWKYSRNRFRSGVARGVVTINNYQRALYRRVPWYPEMKVRVTE
jgi:glycosyltransferase involved in cell wall biosynthesis